MTKIRRTRRTAEEARSSILDAAERRLIELGPNGLRLQQIAADVGVSHPTVLHHFGSREGLVEAVVDRAFAALDADVISALAEAPPGEAGVAAMLGRVLEALTRGGHARTIAWLALSNYPAERPGRLDIVVDAVHARRAAAAAELKQPPPTREDSAFTVLLSGFVLVGEALVGKMMFDSLDRDASARSGARFRTWLGRLLVDHIERGARPPPK